jgi:hypothetical protein
MNILIEQYKLFNDDNLMLDYIIYHNIMVYDKITNPSILLNTQNINYTDLEFKYDNNNLRIPYFMNNKLIAIKIDLDNIYNYISSTSLIPNNEIIYGEYIQNIADIVIGNDSSLLFNPNNFLYSKKLYTINQIHDLTNYKKIFVFTHDLEDFYNKFNNQLSDKIILSHNSDHEIKYIKDVELHLAQNCLIRHKKLVAIPIGIENTQWFDHNIFHKVRKMRIPKTKNIYFYFNLNTHITRNICYNKLISNPLLEWNIKRNKEDYFKELASHKYAICPRGNGLDTHRIWECLYLDVIPIMIEDDSVKIDNLPIIILKDWDELLNDSKEILKEFKNQELNKLTLNYYKSIIY